MAKSPDEAKYAVGASKCWGRTADWADYWGRSTRRLSVSHSSIAPITNSSRVRRYARGITAYSCRQRVWQAGMFDPDSSRGKSVQASFLNSGQTLGLSALALSLSIWGYSMKRRSAR